MKAAAGCHAPRRGSGQGCAGEGTSLSRSEGTALLRGSCWWSSWHSLHVFSRTPQAFPCFVAESFLPRATGLRHSLFPSFLRGALGCHLTEGSLRSGITCQQADGGGMCLCVSVSTGVQLALGVQGRVV